MKGFSFPQRRGMKQRHGPHWDALGGLVLSPARSPSEDACCHLAMDFRAGSFAAWLWSWQMPWFYQGSWPGETLSGNSNLCLSLKPWRGEKLLFTPVSWVEN